MITKIFDYGMNGEGVSKVDGKILLINGALIDEEVDVDIVQDHDNYATAKINYICTKSACRTSPPCPYFTECGGCDLQHMSYDEQLRFKRSLVKKTIRKIANIECEVSPTIPSKLQYGYRNKISINVDQKSCGFYRESTKDIIDIDRCLLASDTISKIYTICKDYISSNDKRKLIRNIVIREIDDQILVGFVCREQIDLSNIVDRLLSSHTCIGVYQIINRRHDSVVLSGKVRHLGGIQRIKVNNYDLTYFVDIMSFHQTNIDIQDKIYSKVLEYIRPNMRVVNGFSGQGLLTAIISKVSNRTIGIEIDSNAHKTAEELKLINKIENMVNVLGDFNNEMPNYIDNIDMLILDPSKKGCGEKILSTIQNIGEIVYISCNPIALAKDLKTLSKNYDIEEIIPYDMFPNTKSVETLVKLKLKENKNDT